MVGFSLDDEILAAPCLSEPSATSRSYANVVKGGGFCGAGRCNIVKDSRGGFVQVGTEGVKERTLTLDRSLVIGFIPSSSIVFISDQVGEFRRFAEHNWGIDINYGLEDLKDGRWLLLCPRLSELLCPSLIDVASFVQP
ncbi:unnamed protein product [Linum trigynum]|uniref:Uncharacterized protein n=1 Tax=Linum trigynum TaxID=586398 RepID=A0AAV2E5C2_9ROSI